MFPVIEFAVVPLVRVVLPPALDDGGDGSRNEQDGNDD